MARKYSKKTARKLERRYDSRQRKKANNAIKKAKKKAEADKTVKWLRIDAVSGSNTDVRIRWECTLSHIESFTVHWEYWNDSQNASKKSWTFGGDVTGVKQRADGWWQYVLTCPSNTDVTRIRVKVKPVSTRRDVSYDYWDYSYKATGKGKHKKYVLTKTKKTKTAKNVAWWDGQYCSFATAANPYFVSEAAEDEREAVAKPATLAAPTVKYESGSAQPVHISWTAPTEEAATQVVVRRYLNVTGKDPAAMAELATVTSSVTDYYDVIGDGNFAVYTVTPYNPGGSVYGDESEASETVEQIPLADIGLSVAMESGTSAMVSWTPQGHVGDSHIVYHSESRDAVLDPDKYALSGKEGTDPEGLLIDGLDSGKTYWFSVRRKNGSGESGFATDGGGEECVSCVVGTTPAAPTFATQGGAFVLGGPLEVSWTHNCEDGCAQQKAEVHVYYGDKAAGASLWDGKPMMAEYAVEGPAQVFQVPTDGWADGKHVSVEVRTCGIAGTWSEWAGGLEFGVYAEPSPTVVPMQGDAAVTDSSPLSALPLKLVLNGGSASMDVVEWAVGIEPESSLEYTADDGEEDTLSAGEVMYQAYLDGTDPGFGAKSSTLEVSAADGVFISGVVYLVRATAIYATGVSVDGVTARFAVSYAGDLPAPTATVVADGLSCTIVPECRDAEGALVDGVTLAVYRIAYDGESVRIASGMANSGSSACTDWFADMGGSTYRIVAEKASTDEHTASTVEAETPADYIAIDWGERISIEDDDGNVVGSEANRIILRKNVKTSEKYSPDSSLQEYIGRMHPVKYAGTQVGQSASWSASIKRGVDDQMLDQLRSMAVWNGQFYVREPSGAGYWADVKVSGIDSSSEKIARDIKLEITQIEVG